MLRIARGGANWRCSYCRSDQRRPDGSCRRCGASAADATAPTRAPIQMPDLRQSQRLLLLGVAGVAVLALLVCGGISLRSKTHVGAAMTRAGADQLALPFEDVRGKVREVTWHHRVDVERYQKVPKEGFEEARSADAVDSRPTGQRFHHNEKVLVGTRTEHYTVTEPDGYNTETYTERESCRAGLHSAPRAVARCARPATVALRAAARRASGGGQPVAARATARSARRDRCAPLPSQ